MNNIIKQYKVLKSFIKENGDVFGFTLSHTLTDGLPILSDKLVNLDNVISELRWYLKGRVDVKTLWEMGNHSWDDILYDRYKIWTLNNKHLGLDLFTKEEFINTIKNVPDFSDGWAHPGPMYGKQWRDFNGVDQIGQLVSDLKTNSNKILYISSWNTNELQFMAFNPNHNGFQIHKNDNKLSLSLSILRCDVTKELPHLILLYSLFLEVLSKELSLKSENIIFNIGEAYDSEPLINIDYNTEFYDLKLSSVDIFTGNFNIKIK